VLSRRWMNVRCCVWILASVAFVPISSFCGHSQAQTEVRTRKPRDGVVLRGYVRYENAEPVPDATIYLQDQAGVVVFKGQTGNDGSYLLRAVGIGTYTLRAEKGATRTAILGPFAVGAGEEKQIDLTIGSAVGEASTKKSGGSAFQFDDEPNFTVAGVTEAANAGGHGSNTRLQATEALTQQAVSLGSVTGASSISASIVRDRLTPTNPAAETSLRAAVNRSPEDFGANHRLGTLLVETGRSTEALQYLERASVANPDDFENTFELARAQANVGQGGLALTKGRTLLVRHDASAREQAALHHWLGDVEERLDRPFEAVQDYQSAAELDPDETNLFDWGAELLMHRALAPAAEVFTRGNRLFPRSARILIGLGVANYAHGFNEEAISRLCEASDLDPDDADPYLFLGRLETAENVHSGCLVEKLQRFAKLQPNNALANYYYALTMDKFGDGPEGDKKLTQIRALLEKAVALDPNLSAAHLQLGVLYSDQNNFSLAIPAYQKAIEGRPDLAEAHFRLAHAYSVTGEKARAQDELELYRQTSKKAEERAERERHEIQQFVFTLRSHAAVAQPPAQ
jgi:tetratricopeptide (TPR) repeat protein